MAVNTLAVQHRDFSSTDVVILCGGLGTRLNSVLPNVPKILAPIAGRTFLDILIDELLRQGLSNFILCVGYLGEQVIEHVRTRLDGPGTFKFSTEEHPLGTGGALRNALPLTKTEEVFVLNGDSFCKIAYRRLYDFHVKKNSSLSIVLVKDFTNTDTGNVALDEGLRIMSFREKQPTLFQGENWVSSGIYLVNTILFESMMTDREFMLEEDYFPTMVSEHRCFGFTEAEAFIDIGTPKRLSDADKYFARQRQLIFSDHNGGDIENLFFTYNRLDQLQQTIVNIVRGWVIPIRVERPKHDVCFFDPQSTEFSGDLSSIVEISCSVRSIRETDNVHQPSGSR